MKISIAIATSILILFLPVLFAIIISKQLYGQSQYVMELGYYFSLFVTALCIFKKNDHNPIMFSLKLNQNIVLCFGIVYLIDQLAFFLSPLSISPTNTVVGVELILEFVGTVLLAPIAEEFAFRVVLYKKIEQAFNKTIALILTNSLWTSLHFSNELSIVHYLAYFLSGVVFSHFMSKAHGFITVVIAHSLLNLLFFVSIH
ncbi:CPBP family intramembrane glutamic endopeptidase [Thalassotalea marina]|uniref:CAAX prenyl protease 2/Lysostaphin resistance protein A-like domain-containing protein n=1 Tax=Thalassotalea marina TaxID=1673741 RepID=A0A919EQI8_9GAMM|nr:type II CAAX endopeptidase family protein [Thalassotalea marina]GHG08196.1 hypothetical protein GCM10017161_42460 [Thalassotalea marina]